MKVKRGFFAISNILILSWGQKGTNYLGQNQRKGDFEQNRHAMQVFILPLIKHSPKYTANLKILIMSRKQIFILGRSIVKYSIIIADDNNAF